MGATFQMIQMTEELYLRSVFEPDAEFVDGTIERAAGEYDHADWQQAICNSLLQHAKVWNIRVLPTLRVRVAPTIEQIWVVDPESATWLRYEDGSLSPEALFSVPKKGTSFALEGIETFLQR